MERVILRLGYGIDKGLSPAEVAIWRLFPYIPPTSQGGKTSRRASTVVSELIEHDCGIVCLLFMCVIAGPPGRPAKGWRGILPEYWDIGISVLYF